jgi:hypothetical protein
MTNEFELFSDLDFDAADRILARMEAEAAVRRDIVTSLRVSNALLRGRVLDAEALIATMQDPVPALAELADWKRRYAGMPHGQWNGEW